MQALKRFFFKSTSEECENTVQFKLCRENEIPEKGMKIIKHSEADILLVKDKEKLYALGTKCSHYGAPLEKGVYFNGQIRCPWHGACFKVKSGDIEDFPGFGKIPCYQVSIRNGNVYVKSKINELGKVRIPFGPKRNVTNSRCFVVVGGGAAGFQCVQTLKAESFQGKIILITEEDSPPYDRTKLSKALSQQVNDILLLKQSDYNEDSIDLLLNKKVTKLDTNRKVVICSDNDEISYEKIFLATGVIPRKHGASGSDLKNIFYLRNHQDANLIAQKSIDKDVVVIGTSFIGMEVASFLNGKAKSINIVGRSHVPFANSLSDVIGKKLKELFEEKEIIFHCNTQVVRFEGDEEVSSVVLDNGTTLKADICVIGIGSSTNTDYLKESGIECNSSGYVIVNRNMKTNKEDVYAGGDMVTFPLISFGIPSTSIGHWQIAQFHGKMAAFSMLGKKSSTGTVPFFWSSLLGKNIRFAGSIEKVDETIIKGNIDQWKFIAYYLQNEMVIGVCTVGYDPLASTFALLYSQGIYLKKSDLSDDPNDWTKLLNNESE